MAHYSRYFLWYVPLAKWRTFESDAMPMHDWLFNQEYNLEQCLGEEGLASVFAVTNWRYIGRDFKSFVQSAALLS